MACVVGLYLSSWSSLSYVFVFPPSITIRHVFIEATFAAAFMAN